MPSLPVIRSSPYKSADLRAMSKYPVITNCLVCDDLRPEMSNKLTILGFYGIVPNVVIRILDFKLPFDRLRFLFMAEGGDGSFKVAFRLLNQKQEAIFTSDPLSVKAPSGMRYTNLAMGVDRFLFPGSGSYKVVVSFDGKDVYEAPFTVEQGEPKDFGFSS